MFTRHLLFDHFQFTLIHEPNIPGSYAMLLLFTELGFTSITSHIHNWVFLLWFCHFILSGVISPLISSSLLGTYWPGEFLLQHPIILPFHTVHGVLEARVLKWFAIPFTSRPHSVKPLHHDPCILCGPTEHGLVSLSDTRLWSVWSDWLVFCDCGFSLSALWFPLSMPTILFGFLLPWMWVISSWAAPAKHSCCSFSWMWVISSWPPLLTLDVG